MPSLTRRRRPDLSLSRSSASTISSSHPRLMIFSCSSIALMDSREWLAWRLFVRLFGRNLRRHMLNSNEVGIVARSGARRLRWFALAVAAPLFGVVAAFGTVQRESDTVPLHVVVEPLRLSPTRI